MLDCKPNSIPIEAKLDLSTHIYLTACGQLYRQLIGCLMYGILATQPDLSYCLNYFNNFQSIPEKFYWEYLKNDLGHIKGTLDYSIIYRKQSDHTLIFEGFVNADWANHKDR